jgi:methylenetetrahydrofolate dehydrogenase (NADP+)/methenyltetrahydrofolate cyclohydrolase
MVAKILDGKKIAEEVGEDLRKRVESLKAKGINPRLDVVLVGEDPASIIYTRKKVEESEKIGISGELHKLSENISQEELSEFVEKLNNDRQIHGILVQLPLPKHINENEILSRISPRKDVDGLNPKNMGNLLLGEETFEPCTPKGIIRMLDHEGIEIQGEDVVIVNRSNIVGKPLAFMMLKRNGTVTLCHSKTKDLAEHTRRADILVVGVGKAKFFTKDMVKEGSTVIDVGINRVEGKLYGDVDFENVKEKAKYITPVPGGVGPLTVAMVLENTVLAAERFGKG